MPDTLLFDRVREVWHEVKKHAHIAVVFDKSGSMAGEKIGHAIQGAQAFVSAMDPKADPCQDFYRYACGGWLDATKLPADHNRWSRSFSEITERNRERPRGILEELQKNPGDADRRRLADFYGACMDEAAVEKAGLDPLKPFLAEIDALKDKAALMPLVARLHHVSMPAFFGLYDRSSMQDPGHVRV